jgi:hypothetical protein
MSVWSGKLPGLKLSGFFHVSRLRTFLAFDDFKFDIVSFLETLVAFGCDGAEVNKNVGTILSSDEPVSFCVIEPLYGAFHPFLAYIPVSTRPVRSRLLPGIWQNYDARLRD